MPILTIVRNPVIFFSEAFSNVQRDLGKVFGGGIFGDDLSRPLQQPVARPDLVVAQQSSGKVPSGPSTDCLGNEADCKSDDDDEAGGRSTGHDSPQPVPIPFSSLPSHVMACLGNEADCKSDDDDEAGSEAMPGHPAPQRPDSVARRIADFFTHVAPSVQRFRPSGFALAMT